MIFSRRAIMSITINEALELKLLKNFKVIAGEKGLNKEINRVGILDHETPEMIENFFLQGELLLTNLLLIKDDINMLYSMVDKMIKVESSGLAIKNIYFNEIPPEVVQLADESEFPILMFSETYLEDIITTVMNAIKEKSETNTLSLKLDNILYSNLDHVIIKKIAYEINGNFKEKNIVAYCKRIDGRNTTYLDSYRSIHENKPANKIISYKGGTIFINTFENVDPENASKIVLRRLQEIGISEDQYFIGISSLYHKLGELKFSINESLYAYKNSLIYQKKLSYFNNIGLNRILLPVIENPWIIKYHDEMIEPIIVHDNKYETELLKTAITYIENNGDIKATASELFQHGNTIRYRIDKIRKILNLDTDSSHFYEELALAIRIYNIINMPL
jgi:hypothetical protein